MNELLEFLDLKEVILEVFVAMGPLVVFFVIFQFSFLKLPREYVINLVKGVIMAFLGLILFLQGVKVGFLPAGLKMGEILGAAGDRWILIPVGFSLGFAATVAEPAVRILCFEVERTSSGAISSRVILFTLAFGVAFFVALGMVRIIYGIPIQYFIIPGYLLAIAMVFFTDSIFVSIAFDAGGVATGPMTVTFVMALAVGVATIMEGRSPVLDGFGLIALVAMAPILSVMALGLLYSMKKGRRS
jgi:hypothetical protein